MRSTQTIKLIVFSLLFCALSVSACASNWSWPSEMSIAGFSISRINGTASPDGSGKASASIHIPGVGQQSIKLVRSSSGDVTSDFRLKSKLSGAELEGDFTLDSSGLRGEGTVRCTPKSITDVTMEIESDGKAVGNGTVALGSIGVSASFALSGSSFGLEGKAPAKAHADSPLAIYDFAGNLELGGNNGRILVTAKGTVTRTGKITNEVTQEDVSSVSVDPVDGHGKINVKGVSVTFSFFDS